jgi:Leucine-rich repeat (LRR) protein
MKNPIPFPLAGLTNLRSLDLNDNRIGALGPLVESEDLEQVDLEGDLIKDWSPVRW